MLLAVAVSQALACGSDSDAPPAGTGGVSGSGAVSGLGGAGGASSGGATATGGALPGGAGGIANGGTAATGGSGQGAACGTGKRTTAGTCYMPCQFSPGLSPYYDGTGSCGPLGWRCSEFQYCNVNLKCANDATCTTYMGPGWRCIDAASGPLVGQCALGCSADTECPGPSPVTGTPYACGPVETKAGMISVCRFGTSGMP